MSAQSAGRPSQHPHMAGDGSGSSTDMSAAEGEELAIDRAAASAAATASVAAPLQATDGEDTYGGPQTHLQEDAASAERDLDDSEADEEGEETILAKLRHMFHMDQGLRAARPPLLDSFDLQGIASYISSGRVRRIICMCGAGISVNAGIPDFRSPGTGLYDNLAKYDLPRPESVFELSYFRQNPKPFYMLSKELFPGAFKPTPTHSFIRLLHEKRLLQRCYTQNIDSLEREAGTPADLIVAAHGNFDAAHCIDCRHEVAIQAVKHAVLTGEPCLCPRCKGLVKPDIVFFGEGLPSRFFKLAETDFASCDLLLVIGTSLVVQPFASLVGRVDDDTPRLLINKEKVSGGGGFMGLLSGLGGGDSLDFSSSNYRDALYLGDCDEGVWELCKLLGWQEELQQLVHGACVVDWESEGGQRQHEKAAL